MRALLYLCTGLFVSGVAFGQVNAGAYSCAANAGIPPTLRSEGMTELVGDIVLQCTGGMPTPLGQLVPTANITVQFNTAVTSRQFSNGTSEALLLIDEPGSATNPNTPQIPCLTLGGCPILGTAGAGTYNGTPGHPNIFQGTPGPGPNTVTWNGMPIDAPGTAGFHIYRITNIRANANQLGLAGQCVHFNHPCLQDSTANRCGRECLAGIVGWIYFGQFPVLRQFQRESTLQ
jgi:hypothetical protein